MGLEHNDEPLEGWSAELEQELQDLQKRLPKQGKLGTLVHKRGEHDAEFRRYEELLRLKRASQR